MKREQIERAVNRILDDCLGISFSQIDTNARMCADFGVDSIDEVELVDALERKFGFHVEDEEIEWGDDWTIGEIYDLVERKMK